MSTSERAIGVGGPSIETVATVAEVRWKAGHDIVVAVKDGPNGFAVDVREVITRDAYRDSDFRVVGGSTRKPRRQKDPYVGPTKRGFWWSEPETAIAVGEAIIEAALDCMNRQADA